MILLSVIVFVLFDTITDIVCTIVRSCIELILLLSLLLPWSASLSAPAKPLAGGQWLLSLIPHWPCLVWLTSACPHMPAACPCSQGLACHSFIHASSHPLIHSVMHQFMHPAIQPLVHPPIPCFFHSFDHLFVLIPPISCTLSVRINSQLGLYNRLQCNLQTSHAFDEWNSSMRDDR